MKSIYKILMSVIVCLFLFNSVNAYEKTKTRLYLSTKNGYTMDKLVFGIDPNATSSLDTALGENDAPPFPVPDGMNAGFYIYDSTQQSNVWTYLDLRPYPSSDTAWVYYRIEAAINSGDILTVKWNPIGPEIDSAIIIDRYTNGFQVKVDMKKETTAKMPNEFIYSLLMKVKYPTKTISVSEYNDNSDKIYITNPVSDEMQIFSELEILSLNIINSLGETELLINKINSKEKINLSGLNTGIYYVIINCANSTSFVKKVIKL